MFSYLSKCLDAWDNPDAPFKQKAIGFVLNFFILLGVWLCILLAGVYFL